MSFKSETRHLSSNLSPKYDRPLSIAPERRRSPSPSNSAGYPYNYDRYVPARSGPLYGDDNPNGYRSDSWRPERPYYGLSPSPERYGRHRDISLDTWSRPSHWHAPDTWPDRRNPPTSPFDESWPRPRREVMAERMFEPSETWKQSHHSSPEHSDGLGKTRGHERLPNFPPRDILERSPERPLIRDGYTTFYPGDRYRPYSLEPRRRESFPYMDPRSDSYRPQYDDGGSWNSYPELYANGYDGRPRDHRSVTYPMRLSSPHGHHGRRFSRERSLSVGSSHAQRNSPPVSPQTNPFEQGPPSTRPPDDSSSYLGARRRRSLDFDPHNDFKSPSTSPSSRAYSHLDDSLKQVSRDTSEPHRDNTESIASTPRAAASKEATPPHTQPKIDEAALRAIILPLTEQIESTTPVHEHHNTLSPPSLVQEDALNEQALSIAQQLETSSLEDVVSSSFLPTTISQPETAMEPDAPTESSLQTWATSLVPASIETSHEPEVSNLGPFDTADSVVDIHPVTIPAQGQSSFMNRMSISDALKRIVQERLRRDRQTREELIAPVILSNLSIAEVTPMQRSISPDPESVVQEVMAGDCSESRSKAFDTTKSSLERIFAAHQTALTLKLHRLREEYIFLHRQWLAHCAKLDEDARAGALEDAAATAGRTTRRSAANMGDAVRSDFEMEQIIASLGNDELTDASNLSTRNAANIPNMISVERGQIDYTFDDTNNLVENPHEFYAPRTGIYDWTDDEKQIFLEKFAAYPKQFGLIADFLPHKTAAQCVSYYYLHKNFIDFRKVVAHYSNKRKRGARRAAKKKGNALLTDIRKRDDEVSRNSTPDGRTTRRRKVAPQATGETSRRPTAPPRRGVSQLDFSPTSTPTPDPEEPRRRRRRTNPTFRAVALMDQDDADDAADVGTQPVKRTRRGRKPRASDVSFTPTTATHDNYSPTPEARFIDQTELTSRRKPPPGTVVWSDEDKSLFLELLAQYGDDFKRIASSMPNKTTIQVSVFYKTHEAEMDLERVAASAPKRSPTPETQRDNWKEASFTHSGAATPNTVGSVSTHRPTAATSMQPRFRNGEHGISTRRTQVLEKKRSNIDGQFFTDNIGTSSSSYSSTSTRRMQYDEPLDLSEHTFVAHMAPHPSPFTTLSSMAKIDHISDPSAFAPPPSTLTTTFPATFAYTNLGPSHFAVPRRETSGTALSASRSVTYDPSIFLRQPWSRSPPLTASQVLSGLNSVEDMQAWIEYRTKVTSQNPSYFDEFSIP